MVGYFHIHNYVRLICHRDLFPKIKNLILERFLQTDSEGAPCGNT